MFATVSISLRTQRGSMKFSSLQRPTSLFLFLSLGLTACGYSQEEWDQKLRENESLTQQLKAQTDAHKKSQSDYQEAVQEIDALKKQLADTGVSVSSLTQSVAEKQKALEEYARRTEQLDQIRKRFELLQTKLQKLTQLGLKVEVRNNRMLIQLPGDVLFDSGQDKLKAEGSKILMQVAEVIGKDADLSKRLFQVAGHTDSKPLVGGVFKDNWGLSTMRARSVVLLLTSPPDKKGEGGGGLNPSNWSAAGYADTDPVAPNDTDEGRKKNRRVELVVQPDVEEMLSLKSLAKNRASGDLSAVFCKPCASPQSTSGPIRFYCSSRSPMAARCDRFWSAPPSRASVRGSTKTASCSTARASERSIASASTGAVCARWASPAWTPLAPALCETPWVGKRSCNARRRSWASRHG